MTWHGRTSTLTPTSEELQRRRKQQHRHVVCCIRSRPPVTLHASEAHAGRGAATGPAPWRCAGQQGAHGLCLDGAAAHLHCNGYTHRVSFPIHA